MKRQFAVLIQFVVCAALGLAAHAQRPAPELKHFAKGGLSFDYPAEVTFEDQSEPGGGPRDRSNMRTYCLNVTSGKLIALARISLSVPGQMHRQKDPSAAAELLEQFKNEKVFWRQMEVGKKLVALHDTSVLPKLSGWMSHEDRHIRGNVAFIFAALGDDRGFEVINAILHDRSDRPQGQGQGVPSDGTYHVKQQIWGDRYYAVHLFVDLKDRRAVPILIPLLHDEEVKSTVMWALGEIGDKRADRPLINELDDKSPSIRVLAILALGKLGATEALPRLHALLEDHEKTNFADRGTVAEAAKAAIEKLESPR